MITTEDNVIFASSSLEIFEAPRMVCFPTYNVEAEMAYVQVSVRNGSGRHYRYEYFEITKTDLNAASISAGDNTGKWMEAVEETVKAKMESLNPGATFSIS